jgi:hypothetical protein
MDILQKKEIIEDDVLKATPTAFSEILRLANNKRKELAIENLDINDVRNTLRDGIAQFREEKPQGKEHLQWKIDTLNLNEKIPSATFSAFWEYMDRPEAGTQSKERIQMWKDTIQDRKDRIETYKKNIRNKTNYSFEITSGKNKGKTVEISPKEMRKQIKWFEENIKQLEEKLRLSGFQYLGKKDYTKKFEKEWSTFVKEHPEINKPLLNFTNSDIRPKKIDDESFLKDALHELRDFTDENIINLIIDILFEEQKQGKDAKRVMNQREEYLNSLLLALENDTEIDDTLRENLKTYDVLSSKFLVKLDKSLFANSKAIHPRIVDKLVTVNEEDNRKTKTPLFKKFAKVLKTQFNKTYPNVRALEGMRTRLTRKDKPTHALSQIVKNIVNDEYNYNDKSEEHLTKITDKYVKLTSVLDEIINMFWDDDNNRFTLAQLEDISVEKWNMKSDKYKSKHEFETTRGRVILDYVKNLEAQIRAVKRYKNAQLKLVDIINEEKGTNVSPEEDYHADFLRLYREIREEIEEYDTYKKQIDNQIEELSQQSALQRERAIAANNKDIRTLEDMVDWDASERLHSKTIEQILGIGKEPQGQMGGGRQANISWYKQRTRGIKLLETALEEYNKLKEKSPEEAKEILDKNPKLQDYIKLKEEEK